MDDGHGMGQEQSPGELVVEGVVTALAHEFEVVNVEASNGYTLLIGERTRGVDWRTLEVGQRLRCTLLDLEAPRVLAAEVIGD